MQKMYTHLGSHNFDLSSPRTNKSNSKEISPLITGCTHAAHVLSTLSSGLGTFCGVLQGEAFVSFLFFIVVVISGRANENMSMNLMIFHSGSGSYDGATN